MSTRSSPVSSPVSTRATRDLQDTERAFLRERPMLIMAGAFLFINFLALALLRGEGPEHWWNFAVWVGCAGLGTYYLERILPQRDAFIFPCVMLLAGWGILIVERIFPIFADRQTVWLVLGVLLMLLTAGLPQPLRWLRQYRYILLVAGLLLLIATIILGRNPSGFGPQLWLQVGDIFFQPSEALKLILVSFLASYLAEQVPTLRKTNTYLDAHRAWLAPRILGPIFLMWGLSIIILVWQRDLGTALLFFFVFITLLYLASGNRMIIIAGLFLTFLAGFVAYQLFSVVQLRVDIWLNPWPEADNRAYQIVQSLMAFGSGGIFGQGIGQGLPTFIPVLHSDFIFAALAEEWGLIGVIVVIATLAIIIFRGLHIALQQQERPFFALLAAGLSILLGFQSLLITGGVLKLIPLTGITFPFFSYGGSSLVVSFIVIGLILRLSSDEAKLL